jgi:tetratricopeptide (TPR) repeat protein
MFFRKFSLPVLALACAFGVSRPVLAQSNPNAPDPTTEEGKRAEGKARYERGAAAYSAGRFKDAIDLFLQADALASSAALSFNIARAYEKIGDDAASLQWYRDFRRREESRADDRQEHDEQRDPVGRGHGACTPL